MKTRLPFTFEGGAPIRAHVTDTDGINRELTIGMMLMDVQDLGPEAGKNRFQISLAWQTTVEPPAVQ